MGSMGAVRSSQAAELLAPTAELRGMLAEMRREIDILRRRDALRETQLLGLRSDFERAARIQQQLNGELPVLHGAVLAYFTHPVDRVSGDFHFARRTSTNTVSLGLADATGHGLAAGLISAALTGMLDLAVPTGSLCANLLSILNRQLLSYAFDDCEFVTAVLAEYDENSRKFRWARAGGPPPVLIRKGHSPRRLKSEGLPLGVEAVCEFEPAEIQLEPGDAVLLHTDGMEAVHTRIAGSRSDEDFLHWAERRVAQGIDTLAGLMPSATYTTRAQNDDVTTLLLQVVR